MDSLFVKTERVWECSNKLFYRNVAALSILLAWIMGNSREAADFEIAELIRLSSDKRTIVDTSIPLEILKQIADYNQVAIMLSPQSLSVDMFFERDEEEKRFLLSQIKQAVDPKKRCRISVTV